MEFKKLIARIVVIFSIALLAGNICVAQTKSSIFKLQAKLASKIDSLSLRYTTTYEEQYAPSYSGKLKKFEKVGNNLQIQIDSADNLFYLKFPAISNLRNSDNHSYLRLKSSPVLVWPDMDLQMEITEDSVVFTGHDSSFLHYQMELRKLYKKTADKKRALNIKYDLFHGEKEDPYNRMWNYLLCYHKVVQESIEKGKVLLKQYSKSSNANAYNQVWYDWIGNLKFNQINNIHFLHEKYSEAYNPAIEDFYKQYLMPTYESDLVSAYDYNSIRFPQYLYYKSKSDLIFLLYETGTDLYPPFETLLDLLSARYKGKLFDQVAFSAMLHLGANKYIDENTYLKLISRLENPGFKRSVGEKLARKSKYRSGYQFTLEDRNGRVLTPKDFKGKTVIMDFWYTGCFGCKGLYRHLKPIKKTLSSDSNVVVLSVNVDKTKSRWLETLNDPLNGYTDSTNINVWVGENMKQNPLILYYDILSFPTLLILNGNNEIQSYNPAYRSDLDKKSLLTIINKSLNKISY